MSVGSERGVALALTVFALLLLGALVAGSFVVAAHEHRVGYNTITLHRALLAAEEGATRQVATVSPATLNALAVGDSLPFDGLAADGRSAYRGSVLRLSQRLFLVQSEGFTPGSGARRHLGVLVRLFDDRVAAISERGWIDLF